MLNRIRRYFRRRKVKAFLLRELPQALFGHIEEVSDEDMKMIRSKYGQVNLWPRVHWTLKDIPAPHPIIYYPMRPSKTEENDPFIPGSGNKDVIPR